MLKYCKVTNIFLKDSAFCPNFYFSLQFSLLPSIFSLFFLEMSSNGGENYESPLSFLYLCNVEMRGETKNKNLSHISLGRL